jgi:DNA-binding NtrC family response regulator
MQEERKTIKAQLQRVREELAERYDLVGIVFDSAVMHELVGKAVRIARGDEPVLITGEVGVGKRKLAELIHANSERRSRPLVRVNADLQDHTMVEAEIFGANAGAVGRASAEQAGGLEAAAGATILINAIDKLSPAGQMRLLRVLQTGNFERLGSTRMQTTDARVIATGSSKLREHIIRGSFRDDLFFCLALNQIEVPALRDRPEDALALALHLLRSSSSDTRILALSEAARLSLVSHDWPENVRELEERVIRACQNAQTATITPQDLGLKPLTLTGQPRPVAPDKT